MQRAFGDARCPASARAANRPAFVPVQVKQLFWYSIHLPDRCRAPVSISPFPHEPPVLRSRPAARRLARPRTRRIHPRPPRAAVAAGRRPAARPAPPHGCARKSRNRRQPDGTRDRTGPPGVGVGRRARGSPSRCNCRRPSARICSSWPRSATRPADVAGGDLPPTLAATVAAIATPAYVLDRQWNALAWNAPAATLFSGWLDGEHDRNLLRFTFMSAAARTLIVDWETRAAARGRIPRRFDPSPDRCADARTDRRADRRQRRFRAVLGIAGRVRTRRRPARIRPSGRRPPRVPADHAEARAPRGPCWSCWCATTPLRS